MSCPCHQPAKWNGMNTVSGPTRSVTCALTLIFAPVGVLTQTYSLLRMPRSAAARQDERELRAGVLVLLLHALEERRQAPQYLDVVVRRPLVDEVGAGGEQRLAVQGHAVGEVPHHGARLGIAERMAAVLHRHALDASREVGL